jgi:hypothetical protein
MAAASVEEAAFRISSAAAPAGAADSRAISAVEAVAAGAATSAGEGSGREEAFRVRVVSIIFI